MTARARSKSVALDLEHLRGFVHALETEAAERYGELARQMEAHNSPEVAGLFRRLAEIESAHADKWRSERDAELPPTKYIWPGAELPETAPLADAHYLMTPHHALTIALTAERNAVHCFVDLARRTDDKAVRKLCLEMAREERHHVKLVKDWLAKYPKPRADWASDPDPANSPE
jgi:rubrerythrin